MRQSCLIKFFIVLAILSQTSLADEDQTEYEDSQDCENGGDENLWENILEYLRQLFGGAYAGNGENVVTDWQSEEVPTTTSAAKSVNRSRSSADHKQGGEKRENLHKFSGHGKSHGEKEENLHLKKKENLHLNKKKEHLHGKKKFSGKSHGEKEENLHGKKKFAKHGKSHGEKEENLHLKKKENLHGKQEFPETEENLHLKKKVNSHGNKKFPEHGKLQREENLNFAKKENLHGKKKEENLQLKEKENLHEKKKSSAHGHGKSHGAENLHLKKKENSHGKKNHEKSHEDNLHEISSDGFPLRKTHVKRDVSDTNMEEQQDGNYEKEIAEYVRKFLQVY